jgi:uncharacterized membrane protein YphA (DoxX/SURF4 family)
MSTSATPPDLTRLPGRLDRVDAAVSRFMRRYGVRAFRWAMAGLFIVFGILKPLGVSPAEELVMRTVDWVPLLSPRTMLYLIGWWEVAIGLCLLIRPLARLGILLLALQMVGTFMPLVIVPDACYVKEPALGGRFVMWTFTTEAQYILKNLLIIAGALIIGGTVRRPAETGEQLL